MASTKMEKRNTKGSTAPPLTACMVPPLAAAMMSSWVRTTSAPPAPLDLARLARAADGMSMASSSGSGLCRKTWMNYRAVARERGCFDDFVVPIHGQGLLLFVDQNFQEGKKITGVQARSRSGDPAGDIEISDDPYFVHGDDIAGLGKLAIRAALHRKIDDDRPGP